MVKNPKPQKITPLE